MKRKLRLISLFFTLVFASVNCSDPILRDVYREDLYIQGNLPTFLDLLLVIDTSPSIASYRKDLKEEMKSLIEELAVENSRFRIGITSGSAVLGRNQPSTHGQAAFGLDGSFTSSANNATSITEGETSVSQFLSGIDKISVLSAIRNQRDTSNYFFNPYAPGISSYFTPVPSTVNFLLPDFSLSVPVGVSSSNLLTLDTNDENYFDAISMANSKMTGIFPDHDTVDRNNIPLVVLIVADSTDDLSQTQDAEAIELLKNLRRHTVNDEEVSNLRIFSVIDKSDIQPSKIRDITEQLLLEDGVDGKVFKIDEDFSSIVAQMGEILQKPETKFCLQRPIKDIQTLKVTVDGNQQLHEADANFAQGDIPDFELVDDCVQFVSEDRVPVGSEIHIMYR